MPAFPIASMCIGRAINFPLPCAAATFGCETFPWLVGHIRPIGKLIFWKQWTCCAVPFETHDVHSGGLPSRLLAPGITPSQPPQPPAPRIASHRTKPRKFLHHNRASEAPLMNFFCPESISLCVWATISIDTDKIPDGRNTLESWWDGDGREGGGGRWG